MCSSDLPLHQNISVSYTNLVRNNRYPSVVNWDQLEGIIESSCDGTCSVLSMPSIEVEIGAADARHNKKASKITMQR